MAEFKSWNSFRLFANTVRSRSRYFQSADTEEFLKAVLDTGVNRKISYKEGHAFWRAQLGHDLRLFRDEDGNEFEEPTAWGLERMVPRADKASEGRANPRGIPYLYLATAKETAISEVRPWIGAKVSVSQFKLQKGVNILMTMQDSKDRLSWMECLGTRELGPDECVRAVWTAIDDAFSAPVDRNDELAEYIPTQIIAEFIKTKGLDGIAYQSNFGNNGVNIALFDIKSAKPCNYWLHEVTGVNFKFKEGELSW